MQGLQLRVGAGGGKDHVDIGGETELLAQLAAHRFDPVVERALDAVADRGAHQRIARVAGGVIAALRNRGRGA